MRIAHIITRMIVGGAQENTLYNCLDLIRDFQDDVLLITGPTDGPEGRLLEQGRAEGLNVQLVDSLRRSIHPSHDAKAYKELRSVIRSFRPDVVHTHSAKGGILGRAAAWNEKVPSIVHTVHGAPFHPYQNFAVRTFYRLCETWAAKRCHHMISVADAMTDLMVDAKVAPRSKFTTVYSGMDVEPFLQSDQMRRQARQELGIADDEIVVGKIARLFELKGHEYLVAASAEVLKEQKNVRFLLVGDGILRDQIQNQINALGVTDRFLFTGLVPPVSIPKYLSAMDMLVHTSLREGLARTLPQALISGKPVISYDVDGAREVCINEVTGILLPPKVVEPLAKAIIRLAKDANLRAKWGREGQERFTDQFRHQFMTTRIREIYAKTNLSLNSNLT